LGLLRLCAEDGTEWNVGIILGGPAIGEMGATRDLDALLTPDVRLAAITIVEKDHGDEAIDAGVRQRPGDGLAGG
jgi:hypothetical protein